MDFLELNVKEREGKGKSASRQLRQQGFVPAVLYGKSDNTKIIQLKSKEILKIIQDGNHNAILRLIGLPKDTTAIIKEVQKEKTRDAVIHIDFQRVAMDTEIETAVALELIGEAEGVKEGGVLQHSIRELSIKALPKNIPEKIEVDVSKLEIGSAIKVSDLKKLAGVEVLTSPEDNIVSVVVPTELKEEEVVSTEEELKEGEELEEEAEAKETAEGKRGEKESASKEREEKEDKS